MRPDHITVDPFVRRPIASRLSVLGAALTVLLALAMPLVFHLQLGYGNRGHWQLLCFLVFLSSIPAFMLAGRRPFAGAMWLLAVGAIICAWLISQLEVPYYAELLLTPTFWPADLPILGGLIFLSIAWISSSASAAPKEKKHRTSAQLRAAALSKLPPSDPV